MRRSLPTFPLVFRQSWLCTWVVCHGLLCKRVHLLHQGLDAWDVSLTWLGLFCKREQNGLVCHMSCTFCSLRGRSLCEGMFHHNSYIFRLFRRPFGTDNGCVTHNDFAGGAVCPWLVLVSSFSVVLLRSRFSPDFRTPFLVFRSVLELYQLSWDRLSRGPLSELCAEGSLTGSSRWSVLFFFCLDLQNRRSLSRGETPTWNRRGCSSEILILNP